MLVLLLAVVEILVFVLISLSLVVSVDGWVSVCRFICWTGNGWFNLADSLLGASTKR